MDYSGGTEKTGQLLFKDNGNFLFRKVILQDASIVEKKENKILKGWRHFFKLEFPFEGYGKIPRGVYTLSHERDMVFDPFNILSDDEKPDTNITNGLFNRRGIKEVAESTCYHNEHAPMSGTLIDKITWAGIFIAVLFGIGIFIGWV